MILVVNFFEVGVSDMSVYLGSSHVAVAQHGLDGPQIGSIHKQVSGERVAQGVRGDVFGDAG